MGMVNTRLEVNQTVPITFGGEATSSSVCNYLKFVRTTECSSSDFLSLYQTDFDDTSLKQLTTHNIPHISSDL